VQRQEHLPDRLVADRRRHDDAGGGGGLQIPANGFRVEPELGGDALLRQARATQAQDLSDFDHRDLAIHPRLLAPSVARRRRLSSRGQAKGGKVLKISPRKGGKVLKNLTREGGKVLKKSSGKGP
jgi:hypothetical protein